MTFIPFPRPVLEDPNVDPKQAMIEYTGGEMAAYAVLRTIRGALDLARFYRDHGGPVAFADGIFPRTRFSGEARRGFITLFLEIEARMKATGEWRMN